MATEAELLVQEGQRIKAEALALLDRVAAVPGVNMAQVEQSRINVTVAFLYASAAMGVGALAEAMGGP